MERKKVIVIGGGFAGLHLIRTLEEKLFDILLIDRQNHHQFQPLFYQVAAAQLEPSSISFPFRKIFQGKKNIQIRMAEVSQIIPEQNKVITDIGGYHYDFLVIASGCQTNFFGNEEIRKHALTLKTTYESIMVRNQVIQQFEKIMSASEADMEGLMNLVIVGAGPTGVELSGAFAEIRKHILPKDYPGIDFSKFRILLVEGSKHTLNSMSEEAKVASQEYLEKMGVEIHLEVFVKSYDGQEALLSNGKTIRTQNLIWAAGVTGNYVEGIKQDNPAPGNRFRVNRFNNALGYTNIYAIGDIAYMETPKYPKGHPQLANVAINQAKNLSNNLYRRLKNQKEKEFEYRDLGSMATVGKNKAVVDLPFIKFKGYLAWLTWMFLHLMLILSIRNKLVIFINWAWSYFSNDSSLRLILKPFRKN